MSDDVKHTDKLALYCVAHEGISTGSVVGVGKIPKHWSSKIIEELSEFLDEYRVRVYDGHSGDRGNYEYSIGQCVRSFTLKRKPNDILEAYVIIQIFEAVAPKINLVELDVCSLEATLTMQVVKDEWVVENIENITGIALVSSKNGAPGFSRARLIGPVIEIGGDK